MTRSLQTHHTVHAPKSPIGYTHKGPTLYAPQTRAYFTAHSIYKLTARLLTACELTTHNPSTHKHTA